MYFDAAGSLGESLLRGIEIGRTIRQVQATQREAEIQDLKQRLLFESMTKPIEAGMVAETMPAIPGMGIPEAVLRRKPEASRVVRHRTFGGQTLAGELLTPDEQRRKQLEWAEAEKNVGTIPIASSPEMQQLGMPESFRLDPERAYQFLREEQRSAPMRLPPAMAQTLGTDTMPSWLAQSLLGPYYTAEMAANRPAVHIIPPGEGVPAKVVTTKAGKVMGTQPIEDTARKAKEVPGSTVPYSPAVEQQRVRIAQAGKADTSGGDLDIEIPDPTSGSILAQTGLSYPAFLTLVGQAQKLPRDAATRRAAFKEARQFANQRGVDVATLGSQYQSYNNVLASNIDRVNRTRIMEGELQGTIENLQGVVKDSDLSRLRWTNIAKIWANQQVNDPLAQQYAMHLYQLRNELAAYGAATQGRSGNQITIEDMREAERTIQNGVAAGSLNGLRTAVANSTGKMGTVLERSVDSARKAVWDLFGVGRNYKPKVSTPAASGSLGPTGSASTTTETGAEDLSKIPTAELLRRLSKGR